jgi:hypothetical protein
MMVMYRLSHFEFEGLGRSLVVTILSVSHRAGSIKRSRCVCDFTPVLLTILSLLTKIIIVLLILTITDNNTKSNLLSVLKKVNKQCEI